MHVNYRYLLHWAEAFNSKTPGAKILDYGCGSGDVVAAGRKQGLNIYGAEIFYGGAKTKQEVERLGLLGDEIRVIKDGKLGFDDECFDIVLNNQVFEHVEDLDAVLSEIERVMKKGAVLLCLFPANDVIREGHIGIPFVHWFPKDSSARWYYTLCLRSIGLGFFKKGKSRSQWTKDQLDWIDKYTFYRNKKRVFKSFEKYFEVEMIEPDYIKFRLWARKRTAQLSLLLRLPLVPQISRFFFHKFAGMVILAKKKVQQECAV
jgi:ubiquinone/menaquinone biosynthesis C-methylase UbiE